MNSLIPERHTDKNGVISTKWVKPAAEPKPSLSHFPPPSINARKAIIGNLADDIHDVVLGKNTMDREGAVRIGATLAEYSDKLLMITQDFFDNRCSESQRYYGSKLHTVASAIEEGEDVAVVTDFVVYLPEVRGEAVRLLSQYRERHGVKDETSFGFPDPRVLALLASTSVARKEIGYEYGDSTPDNSPLERVIGETGENHYLLRDSRVIQLILDHPESNDLINDIIRARKSLDYETAYAAVKGTARSLSSGVL